MTDEDLMLAVRAGDISRLAPLFERHHRPLFDYLARMTGNRSAAEDLVQDVFVRILKYRHTFRETSRFETWAFRIARNVRADYFQGRRIRETPLDEEVGTVKVRMHRAVKELRDVFLGLSENPPCSVKQPANGLLTV